MQLGFLHHWRKDANLADGTCAKPIHEGRHGRSSYIIGAKMQIWLMILVQNQIMEVDVDEQTDGQTDRRLNRQACKQLDRQ